MFGNIAYFIVFEPRFLNFKFFIELENSLPSFRWFIELFVTDKSTSFTSDNRACVYSCIRYKVLKLGTLYSCQTVVLTLENHKR